MVHLQTSDYDVISNFHVDSTLLSTTSFKKCNVMLTWLWPCTEINNIYQVNVQQCSIYERVTDKSKYGPVHEILVCYPYIHHHSLTRAFTAHKHKVEDCRDLNFNILSHWTAAHVCVKILCIWPKNSNELAHIWTVK